LLFGWALSAQPDELPLRFVVEGPQLEAPVEVVVERWTTDDEKSALREVVQRNDARLTLQALEQQATTGYIALGDGRRFDLHHAAQFRTSGGRRLLLVADRPISRNPDIQASGSVERAMTVVNLDLDAAGNGSGIAVIGADAQIDEATGVVRIITAGGPPVRLESVRRIDRSP
jgi:hypothetical protein